MKKTLLSFIMLFSISIINAQITLNSTDIVDAGVDVIQAHDTIPTGITIGLPGANQTWDFSAVLDDNGQDTLKFRDPLGFPLATDFPAANLVLLDTEEDSAWMYLNKNTNGLFIVGRSQMEDGILTSFPFGGAIITFPSTIGTNFSIPWSGTLIGLDVSTFPLLGLDSIKITRGTKIDSDIDGWGNVITPFGSFSSLRQIVIEESVDTTWEKSTATGTWSIVSPATIIALGALNVPVTDISYDTNRTARWWTDDVNSKFPLVEMSYEADGTVNNVDWQKSSPTVGLSENTPVFSVELYPNPVKDFLTIITSTTGNKIVSVLDITGKVITEQAFRNNSIKISTQNYTNGVYFYKIQNLKGEILYLDKFIVTK